MGDELAHLVDGRLYGFDPGFAIDVDGVSWSVPTDIAVRLLDRCRLTYRKKPTTRQSGAGGLWPLPPAGSRAKKREVASASKKVKNGSKAKKRPKASKMALTVKKAIFRDFDEKMPLIGDFGPSGRKNTESE